MILVETGSSYEKKSQNGLSHFLEHMCFKGTLKRPKSIDIARELDALGALTNAFTSRDMTGYWAKAEKKHFRQLIEIVSDLYLNPTLPKLELEKERGVILQELSMYEDLPKIKVWDELWELLYPMASRGRSIIGLAENIKSFSRTDFVNYRREHYIADKTIVIVAGDNSRQEVLRETRKYFKDIPKAKSARFKEIIRRQNFPGLRIRKKKTDQTHMVIAFRAFGANDNKINILNLLSSVLGQGMSSRLWQKMREELGACYYVYAGVRESADHGVLFIATGIEARRAKEVTKILLEECGKLRDELITQAELEKAKEYYIGHLYMDLETTDSLADFYGDQEILTRKLKTPVNIEKEIRRITAEDIRRVAREVFRDSKLNLAVIGDIKHPMEIKQVLTLK